MQDSNDRDYYEHLKGIAEQVDSAMNGVREPHAQVKAMVDDMSEVRVSLRDSYEKYTGDVEQWRKEVWSERWEPSVEAQYGYLKHQELTLEKLLKQTLPKQLALRREYLITVAQSADQVLEEQDHQLRQLAEYRKKMVEAYEQEAAQLNNRWREQLNENLEKALSN